MNIDITTSSSSLYSHTHSYTYMHTMQSCNHASHHNITVVAYICRALIRKGRLYTGRLRYEDRAEPIASDACSAFDED
ncbi:hypothetical protein BGAL_0016g00070 [Botrytis galanthina]|uniref:Uncharacterized protein n=1 Tax=Botrytis galanthina TaxID=278940 RepID=A0A4S8RMJ5_9HELO|nr:hypothetical protein BGAL_0016g00070 [Botrytis galanthina]